MKEKNNEETELKENKIQNKENDNLDSKQEKNIKNDENEENLEKENFIGEKKLKDDNEDDDEEINKILLKPKINYIGHFLFSFFYHFNNLNFCIVLPIILILEILLLFSILFC